jgi:plastocyanin
VIKGQIASIEPDATGQPGWIQSGIWLMRMNSADTNGQNASLIARFQMVKPDGTAMHVHKIFGFKTSEMTQEGNSTVVLKGTATVTMKDGPVADVPLTVKVFSNTVVGFWIGPDKVDGHFGTGAVYGIASDNSQIVMKDMHDMMAQGPPTNSTNQGNVVNMKADEIDEVYRWTTDAGINPTITLVANGANVFHIDNPTDEKHELVIESNGQEVAASGDIDPESTGSLTFTPTAAGTFEYHCEYHPDTMKGTIQVTG